MKKIIKPLFIALGLLAFGLGTLGIFLPVLPTTPLYLLAAFCFARGSERFHTWFTNTRLYRKHLNSFVKNRAMPMKTKLAICIPVSLMLAAAFCFAPIWHAQVLIAAALLFKWWYFLFRIKTIPKKENAGAGGAGKRLFSLAGKAKKYIFLNVLFQWLGLLAGSAVIIAASLFIGRVAKNTADTNALFVTFAVCLAAALLRALFSFLAGRASFLASTGVKSELRERLYDKLCRLGPSYTETLSTAEIVQAASEGADQLEAYFGRYSPQVFYCVAAPVTLFAVLSRISLTPALVMLACAPLIPLLLMMIKKMAGRMMRKQWGSYVTLGGRFLENIQGMTTLKVYAADEVKQTEMEEEAEKFRRSTMRILRMQLGSIIVMDVVAFGGAAAGVCLAARGFMAGDFGLAGALTVALVSAEFFIPLRQLGSYFHVAMNGIAAGERMFAIFDMPEDADGASALPDGKLAIKAENLSFSYPNGREALRGASFEIKPGSLTALAGVSGCGKSTAAALLSGRRRGYSGSVKIGGVEVSDVSREALSSRVRFVTHDSYIFAGTVRENLLLADKGASAEAMIAALKRVRLWDFLSEQGGLDAALTERGANLSGGQRQRLSIARAMLSDAAVYIFDEAASNIDVESEEAIMESVYALAREKAVLLISHRLANLVGAGRIYLLEDGALTESGTHAELVGKNGAYARLYAEQERLENYVSGEADASMQRGIAL